MRASLVLVAITALLVSSAVQLINANEIDSQDVPQVSLAEMSAQEAASIDDGTVTSVDDASNGVPQFKINAKAAPSWPRGTNKVSCDMVSKSGICLFGGRKIVVPNANPKGTVVNLNFNELLQKQVLDVSGNGNHAVIGGAAKQGNSLISGPGRSGSGWSASFNGKNYVEILNSDTINETAKTFSASFWLFLGEQLSNTAPATGCPILIQEDEKGNAVASLGLRFGNRVIVQICAEGTCKQRISVGKVRKNAWTHITFQHVFNAKEEYFKLYINGILDSTEPCTSRTPVTNNWFLGSSKKANDKCAWSGYVDDLQISTKIASAAEVGAASFPALGAIEPGFVVLGCSRKRQCPLSDAKQNCINVKRHLCSKHEQDAGALTVARLMGWVKWSDSLWSLDDANLEKAPEDAWKPKMSLCCSN